MAIDDRNDRPDDQPIDEQTGAQFDGHTEWSRDTQKYAVLTWISFLTSAAFTMIFFAFIDPLVVVDAVNIEAIESREAGYAIGFFFLWANAWVASWFTVRLIRRKRRGPTAAAARNAR